MADRKTVLMVGMVIGLVFGALAMTAKDGYQHRSVAMARVSSGGYTPVAMDCSPNGRARVLAEHGCGEREWSETGLLCNGPKEKATASKWNLWSTMIDVRRALTEARTTAQDTTLAVQIKKHDPVASFAECVRRMNAREELDPEDRGECQ